MTTATSTKKKTPAKRKQPVAKVESAAYVVPAADLIPALRWVNLARSLDETRPHLCSVRVEIEAKVIRLIATDSYRIHIAEIQVPEPHLKFKGHLAAMMQGVHVEALLREFPKGCGSKSVPFGNVKIKVEHDKVSTTAHRFTLASSVDGQFPDWNGLIPGDDEFTTKGTLDIRAIGMIKSNRHMPVALEPVKSGHRLVFPPYGEGAIGFNAEFLLATFTDFTSGQDDVRIRTISPFRPVLIEPKDGYQALVMPVRLNS